MKKLIDNTEVSARSYYYLLDFNDRDNWETIEKIASVTNLTMLTKEQYKELFNIAVSKENFNI